MLPVVANALCCELPISYTTMPRVVPDQREKFENDELFRKLSRETEVRYTSYKDRPSAERQQRFYEDCREGHADVAFIGSGTNFQLSFLCNPWSEQTDEKRPTQEYVNFTKEPGKVHLKSQFIMNGVCVIWRGWLDLQRLDGAGRLDFDDERAMVEDRQLRDQIEEYNQRLREIEDRQRQYQEERERQAEAEAEVVNSLLSLTQPQTGRGANAGANAGVNNGANFGVNAGENFGGNAGANNGANNGANTGASHHSNAGANSGGNNGANIGTNNGANADINTGRNHGANDGATGGAFSGSFGGAFGGAL